MQRYKKIINIFIPSGTSPRAAKGAPMYLLGNRGDLEGAVLRNSWFTQLFVTIKNGVPQGAYVDIFDEMQAREWANPGRPN